jgi:asparagine synthase (glutamine-hydrolysing)
MCGISGLITRKSASEAKNVVSRISLLQHARGPDARGLVEIPIPNGSLILAHNRLKIIDLSDTANQPFSDTSQQYCIVFNGEIYNYLELKKELHTTFKSSSDTEVIVNAYKQWGIGCLTAFNGPFAFALYDNIEKNLYLCRDRFGKKPLFYCWHQGEFYFSSSAKALAKELHLIPNLSYVARGLHYWVYDDTADVTPYKELFAVPAGHYLKINLCDMDEQLTRYYNLQETVTKTVDDLSILSHHELLEKLFSLLDSAINIRLRSDVPLGVSLSGGLDSTTISALVAKKHSSLQSFTFGHPQQNETEAPLITGFIQQYQLTPNYIAPSPGEFSDAFYKTLMAQEAPFPNLSVVAQYLVYRAAKEKGIKVLLGGQGGDEVFMGYRKYYMFYIKQLLHQKKYHELFSVFWGFQELLLAEFSKIIFFWKQRQRYYKKNIPTSLLDLPSVDLNLNIIEDKDATRLRQIDDVLKFSLPTLLRYEDRNSMGHSIESRLPFLDYRLVEFGLALPISLKLNKGYGKWILREIMKDQLPDVIRKARYKRGFDVTLPRYVKEHLGQSIRGSLDNKKKEIKDYLVTNKNIDEIFSDEHLISNPKRFCEAISLLWLLNPYGELN